MRMLGCVLRGRRDKSRDAIRGHIGASSNWRGTWGISVDLQVRRRESHGDCVLFEGMTDHIRVGCLACLWAFSSLVTMLRLLNEPKLIRSNRSARCRCEPQRLVIRWSSSTMQSRHCSNALLRRFTLPSYMELPPHGGFFIAPSILHRPFSPPEPSPSHHAPAQYLHPLALPLQQKLQCPIPSR